MARKITTWQYIVNIGYPDLVDNYRRCPSKSALEAYGVNLTSNGVLLNDNRLVPIDYINSPTTSPDLGYGFMLDCLPVNNEISSEDAVAFLNNCGGMIPDEGLCIFEVHGGGTLEIVQMGGDGVISWPYDNWLDDAISRYEESSSTSMITAYPTISYYIPMMNVTTLDRIYISLLYGPYINALTGELLYNESYTNNLSIDVGIDGPGYITFTASDLANIIMPIFGQTPSGIILNTPLCERINIVLEDVDALINTSYSLRRTTEQEPDHKAIIEEILKQEPRYGDIKDASGNVVGKVKIQSLPTE